jgi:peroxiredoxin
MGKWLMRLAAMVLAVLVLIVTGCPPQEDNQASQGNVPKKLQPPVTVSQLEEPEEKEPIPIDVSETLTPESASIPGVRLPEADEATCLIKVGDSLPDGELTTVDGDKKPIADILGKGGSVVFFWTAGSSDIAEKTAALSLADLQGDALAVYGDKGLAVVAINPKDPPEKNKEILGEAKVSYPMLVDVGGSYFAKVATERLPRIYVLDANGKVVWFDVEFSEVSREALKQTLQVMLSGVD